LPIVFSDESKVNLEFVCEMTFELIIIFEFDNFFLWQYLI
jgi:hypothetical protein